MLSDKLVRAWIVLLVFSMASTAVAVFIDRGATAQGPDWIAAAAGVLIMLLALVKGRIILSRYLGLDVTDFWRRGFNTALSVFVIVLLGLYLVPVF